MDQIRGLVIFSSYPGNKRGGHVANMRDNILHRDHLAFSVRVVVLVLTMTSNLHSDSLSIFKDGKLKPGIYKIQNIYTETFLNIETLEGRVLSSCKRSCTFVSAVCGSRI